MKKFVLGGVAALVIVIGGVLFFLVSNLDSLVKTAIEEVGSKVAGVKVSVSSVKISLADGRGTISGLTVGNPSGFKTPSAFSLGTVGFGIDTNSVTKNPVVVKEILIAAPQVTYELGSGGSNIDAIQKNVQAFVGSGAKAKGPENKSGDETKLVIDLLQLTGGKLTLATPLPGGAATADLPDIKLTNIGKSGGGANPAEVASKVLNAISQSAVKAASNLGVGKLMDSATEAVGSTTKGGVDSVKGLFGK
ncbi:MAG: hypothetical protein HQL45_14980 [Alphaproteobacteria bacterium]|nr:hypothetical protein [Alphaproteobacteria bacterium]